MRRWQWISLAVLGGVALLGVVTWLALLDLYHDDDEGWD